MFYPTPRATPVPPPEGAIEFMFSPQSLGRVSEGDRVVLGTGNAEAQKPTIGTDLEGKKLGAPVFDASFRLFPAFAKKNGIAKWEHVNLTPQLREQSLVQGTVDFISGHYFSSMLDLKARGVKFDDIVAMRYVDFGMDLYANGIIVSPEMMKNEKVVKGFIAATMKGWKDVVADFEKRYGIKVQEFDARASELTERIRTEQTSGRYVADIEFHGETSIIDQRADNFIAEHGGVPNASLLTASFKADRWQTPAWVQAACMLVNTNLVKPADEPKSWKDLADPKWKGKILTDDMRAVGSGQTVFAVLYKTYGEELLAKLQQQNMTIGRDLQENTRRVARGEFPIFINQIIAFAYAIKGLPAKVIVPEDGCPYTPIQGAILRGAPHPNAARLFMNHLLDPVSQTTYAKAWMGIVTKDIAEELTDPDEKVRHYSARALVNLGEIARPALPALQAAREKETIANNRGLMDAAIRKLAP